MSLGPPPAQRRREHTQGPLGPWAATITVDAVSTNHGRHSSLPHEWIFEVGAEWTGPPAVGFPPSLTPVSSRDVVVVTSLEEAVVVARKAAEWFRAGGLAGDDDRPDLRVFLDRITSAFAPGAEPAPDA